MSTSWGEYPVGLGPLVSFFPGEGLVVSVSTGAREGGNVNVPLMLYPGVVADPAVVNSPTVVPGAVTVVCNLVTDPAVVNSPAVVWVVQTNLVADPAVVNSPTVVPGSVTVVMNLVTDAAVVNSPTIVPPTATVVVNLVTDAAVVNTPAVLYTQTVTFAGVLADPAVINTPSVQYTQTVVVSVVVDAATVNSPLVANTQYVGVPILLTGIKRESEDWSSGTFNGVDFDWHSSRWVGGNNSSVVGGDQRGEITTSYSRWLTLLAPDIDIEFWILPDGTNYHAMSYGNQTTSRDVDSFWFNVYDSGVSAIYRYDGSTPTLVGTTTAPSGFGSGVNIRCRIQVIGTTHRYKIWNADTQSQPSSWTVSFTDSKVRGPYMFLGAAVGTASFNTLRIVDPHIYEPLVANTQYVGMYPVITAPRGAFFYADTFTDSNGDPLSSPWVDDGSASSEIQSNQAKFIHNTRAYYDVDVGPDYEFYIDMTYDLPDGGNNQAHLCYRGNFDESGWAAGPTSILHNAYWLQNIRGSASIDVRLSDGAGFGSLATVSLDAAPEDGDTIHYRVRLVGDRHQIKAWLNSDPEPDGWGADFQDGTFTGPHVSIAGYHETGNNDANLWDNFRMAGVVSAVDYFVGADNDPLTNWTAAFFSGSGDIQGNRASVAGNGGFWLNTPLSPDFDARLDVEANGTSYFSFEYRAWKPNPTYHVPADGWHVWAYPTGGINLQRQVGGAGGVAATASITFAGGDIVHFRVLVVGHLHQIKVWLNDDPEPGSWNITFDDALWDEQSPGPWFAIGNSNNDEILFDNIYIKGVSVFEPSVEQVLGVYPELLEAPATVYEPTVYRVDVSVAECAVPATVHEPLVYLLLQFVTVDVLVTAGEGCGPFEVGESYVGDCDELAGEQQVLSGPLEPGVNTINYVVLDLLEAPETIYEPEVVLASNTQTIEMEVVADPATVNALQVVWVIKLDVLADPATVNSPAVAPGAVTIVMNLVADSATVNSPAVVWVVKTNLLAAPASVHSPTIVPDQLIVCNLITAPAVVNAPNVCHVIIVGSLSDPATINNPAVAVGVVSTTVNVLNDPAVVNAPQVYYVVKIDVLSDPAVVNAPTVIPGSVTVVMSLVTDPAVVNNPQVYHIVKVDVVADPAVVNTPAVQYTQTIVVPVVADGTTIHSPQVPQIITVPVVNSSIRQVSHDFTGSNGSSVTGWTTMDALAAPDIFSNRMRVATGEGAWIDTGITGDRIVSFDLIFDSLGPVVSLFGTSSTSTGGADESLDNAEVFNLAPFSGNPSFPGGGGTVVTGAVEDTDTIHFYFEVISGVVYAYVWINADPMPGSPSTSWTLTYQGSYFAFASINGNQAFDNFVVTKYMGVQKPAVATVTTVVANLVAAPSTVLTPTSVTILNYVRPPVLDSTLRGGSTTEDFTGTNGDPPPAEWVTMGNSRTAPEIQTNKLQFNNSDGAYIDTGLGGTIRQISYDLTYGFPGAHVSWIAASNTNVSQASRLDNSHTTNFFFGHMTVTHDGGSTLVGLSAVPGDVVHVLFEIDGPGLTADVYAWLNADPQPGSPSLSVSITPANEGPYFSVATLSGTNDFDNFTVSNETYTGVQTPTVAPQPVYVNANLVTDPAVVNAPAVAAINYVTVPVLVTTGYGSGGYGEGEYGDGGGVLMPAVARVVKPGVVADPAVVNSPTVVQSQVVVVNLVADPAVVNAPTVVPGSVTIAMQLVADAVTVNTPAVTNNVYVVMQLVADPAVVLTPTVIDPKTIVVGVVADPAVINAPKAYYVVTIPVIVDGAVVHTPSVLAVTRVVPGVIADPATVNSPTIEVGPVYLLPPGVSDPSEVFMPLVLGGKRFIPLQVIGFLQPVQIIDVIEKVVDIAPVEQRVSIDTKNPAQSIDTDEQDISIQLMYS